MFGVSTYDSRRRYPGDERQWKKHLQRRLLDGGHDENQLRTCATALAGVVLVVFVIGVVYYSSVQRAGDAPEPIAQVNDMAVAIPRADPPAISNDKVGSSIIARFRSTVPHRNLTLMVQDAEIAGGAVATDTGLAPIPDESAEQEQPMESGDLTSISPDNPHKGEGAIDDDEEQALFNEAVTSAPVVIFSKTWCPFCTEIKKLLLTYNDNGETKVVVAIELDRQKNGHGLMNAVESVVGRRSVPQVFIGGEYFGGLRAVQHARDEGKLKSIIADAVEAFRKVVVDRDDPKPLDSAAHHAA